MSERDEKVSSDASVPAPLSFPLVKSSTDPPFRLLTLQIQHVHTPIIPFRQAVTSPNVSRVLTPHCVAFAHLSHLLLISANCTD